MIIIVFQCAYKVLSCRQAIIVTLVLLRVAVIAQPCSAAIECTRSAGRAVSCYAQPPGV